MRPFCPSEPGNGAQLCHHFAKPLDRFRTQFRCLDFAANFHHSELLSVLEDQKDQRINPTGSRDIPRYAALSQLQANWLSGILGSKSQKKYSQSIPKCHVNRENDDKA
jgi:hypothetical protein